MAQGLVATGRRGLWRRTAQRFDNSVLRELPVENDLPPQQPVPAVVGACFARVKPTPVIAPELVIASREALSLAGIDVTLKDDKSTTNGGDGEPLETLVPFLAGNELFPGSDPAAHCYCGHQFGYFSGQLGDGAAIYLGEVVRDDSSERWEVQLKGAGLTPFSRQADGRKVLRSTMREFLASEHMHALGVPTTRAGSVVVSHETRVLRDMFYDGHAKYEPSAVVMRLAKSFIRFGSFEIFKLADPMTGRRGSSAGLPKAEREAMMHRMLDFTIRQYYPDIWATHSDASTQERYLAFLDEVVRRTARLVAKWQSIGFCHGVLNTDNMSILGDTLDYGPYGFMEHFDPQNIPNTSDDTGRYRYEAQPEICKWNCSVLLDQLMLVIPPKDGPEKRAMKANLEKTYDETYHQEYYSLMRAKLGLKNEETVGPTAGDEVVDGLFEVLETTGGDFTCTFRSLAEVEVFDSASHDRVVDHLLQFSQTLSQEKEKYSSVSDGQFQMIMKLHKEQPAQALRYGINEATIQQLVKHRAILAGLNELSDSDYQAKMRAHWKTWIDAYVGRLQAETANDSADKQRRAAMLKVNPLYVLRNHVAQKAIDFAMDEDYDQVQRIFDLLVNPYDEGSPEDLVYARPEDSSKPKLCVSCSS